MPRPNLFSGRRIETEEIAHGAQRVNLAVHYYGRGARPGRIADLVRAVVLVRPKRLAGFRVDAEHALGPWDGVLGDPCFLAGRRRWNIRAIHHVEPIANDGRARVTRSDRHAPWNLWPAGGKSLEQAALAPDAIALGTRPLRPIVGPRRRGNRAC